MLGFTAQPNRLIVCGSHHRMGKDNLRTTDPVHGNRDIGKGLLAEIERQTGVSTRNAIIHYSIYNSLFR